MRQSSVSLWLVLCFVLLLLLAASGALRADSAPSSTGSDKPTSLSGLSTTLSNKIAELKQRLIERSQQVAELRSELQQLQTALLETSRSLQRSADSLRNTQTSFASYRSTTTAVIDDLEGEIRRRTIMQWVERSLFAAVLGLFSYLLLSS